MNEVDVVARVLGVIGVLLALASLTWQVISWRLSGPRVKVRARVGVVGAQRERNFAAVEALNSGRAAVTVTQWGFLTPDDTELVWSRSAIGSTPLPYRLEPHADGTWFAPWDELVNLAEKNGTELAKVVPFVNLGNGKQVKGRASLRL